MKGAVRATMIAAALLSSSDAVRGQIKIKEPRAHLTQADAGSAHVSVLSVAPWAEYVGALQPAFELSPSEALANAVPNTLLFEERLYDTFAASVKAALPGTSTSSSSTRTESRNTIRETVNGETTEKSTDISGEAASRTRSRTPGDLSAVEQPPAVPSAGEFLAKRSGQESDPAIDPMTRYWAATALYQEVNLLARYVQDAVIGPGREAYVVRLQVSMFPRLRNQALDAYTTLSFVTGRKLGVEATTADKQAGPTTLESQWSYVGEPKAPDAVQVVPILVTDALENSLESRALNRAREFGLALQGLLANVGVGAGLTKKSETRQGLLGHELNSLFSISRAADNTLRVRFGAMNQSESLLGLVPRNYTVTVLLVVAKPKGLAASDGPTQASTEASTRRIQLLGRTEFVNVVTGAALPAETESAFNDRLDKLLLRYDIKVSEKHPYIRGLIRAVERSDEEGFDRLLARLDDAVETDRFGPLRHSDARITARKNKIRYLANFYRNEIWLDIASLLGASPYSTTSFYLPDSTRKDAANAAIQTVTLHDDGKGTSAATAGLYGKIGRRVVASVSLRAGSEELSLMSDTSVVREDGRLLLKFPSLKAMKLCQSAAAPCAFTMMTLYIDENRWLDAAPIQLSSVRYYTPPADPPKSEPKLTTGVTELVARNGQPTLVDVLVGLKKDGGSALLIVREGRIERAEAIDEAGQAVAVNKKPTGLEITKPGLVTLTLGGIGPSRPVALVLKQGTEAEATLLLPVVESGATARPAGTK